MNKPIKIWKLPEAGKKYIIGVDPTIGAPEGDEAAIEIIEEDTGEQCAEMVAMLSPTGIADVAMNLGRFYNEALLAIEVNSFGVVTNTRILQAGYPNPYTTKRYDRLKKEDVVLGGYLTTTKTRELMLSVTQDFFGKYGHRIRSKKLLAEWMARHDAVSSSDERLSAMMIALTVRDERIRIEAAA